MHGPAPQQTFPLKLGFLKNSRARTIIHVADGPHPVDRRLAQRPADKAPDRLRHVAPIPISLCKHIAEFVTVGVWANAQHADRQRLILQDEHPREVLSRLSECSCVPEESTGVFD